MCESVWGDWGRRMEDRDLFHTFGDAEAIIIVD